MGMPPQLRGGLAHLRKADPRFKALIKRHGSPTFERTRNVFESLGRSIVYQQLHGSAAAAIYSRLLALYPRGRFPKPAVLARTPMATLRGVGLSRAKASYILDLARCFEDGTVRPRRFSRMSEEEISRELKQVKGVGQWTADMFLMFGLNRPDVLPLGDYAVKKAMTFFFGKREPKERELLALAEPWRPFRTVASWYMWRVADSM